MEELPIFGTDKQEGLSFLFSCDHCEGSRPLEWIQKGKMCWKCHANNNKVGRKCNGCDYFVCCDCIDHYKPYIKNFDNLLPPPPFAQSPSHHHDPHPQRPRHDHRHSYSERKSPEEIHYHEFKIGEKVLRNGKQCKILKLDYNEDPPSAVICDLNTNSQIKGVNVGTLEPIPEKFKVRVDTDVDHSKDDCYLVFNFTGDYTQINEVGISEMKKNKKSFCIIVRQGEGVVPEVVPKMNEQQFWCPKKKSVRVSCKVINSGKYLLNFKSKYGLNYSQNMEYFLNNPVFKRQGEESVSSFTGSHVFLSGVARAAASSGVAKAAASFGPHNDNGFPKPGFPKPPPIPPLEKSFRGKQKPAPRQHYNNHSNPPPNEVRIKGGSSLSPHKNSGPGHSSLHKSRPSRTRSNSSNGSGRQSRDSPPRSSRKIKKQRSGSQSGRQNGSSRSPSQHESDYRRSASKHSDMKESSMPRSSANSDRGSPRKSRGRKSSRSIGRGGQRGTDDEHRAPSPDGPSVRKPERRSRGKKRQMNGRGSGMSGRGAGMNSRGRSISGTGSGSRRGAARSVRRGSLRVNNVNKKKKVAKPAKSQSVRSGRGSGRGRGRGRPSHKSVDLPKIKSSHSANEIDDPENKEVIQEGTTKFGKARAGYFDKKKDKGITPWSHLPKRKYKTGQNKMMTEENFRRALHSLCRDKGRDDYYHEEDQPKRLNLRAFRQRLLIATHKDYRESTFYDLISKGISNNLIWLEKNKGSGVKSFVHAKKEHLFPDWNKSIAKSDKENRLATFDKHTSYMGIVYLESESNGQEDWRAKCSYGNLVELTPIYPSEEEARFAVRTQYILHATQEGSSGDVHTVSQETLSNTPNLIFWDPSWAVTASKHRTGIKCLLGIFEESSFEKKEYQYCLNIDLTLQYVHENTAAYLHKTNRYFPLEEAAWAMIKEKTAEAIKIIDIFDADRGDSYAHAAMICNKFGALQKKANYTYVCRDEYNQVEYKEIQHDTSLEIGDVVLIVGGGEVSEILWKRNRKLTHRESEICSIDWSPVNADFSQMKRQHSKHFGSAKKSAIPEGKFAYSSSAHLERNKRAFKDKRPKFDSTRYEKDLQDDICFCLALQQEVIWPEIQANEEHFKNKRKWNDQYLTPSLLEDFLKKFGRKGKDLYPIICQDDGEELWNIEDVCEDEDDKIKFVEVKGHVSNGSLKFCHPKFDTALYWKEKGADRRQQFENANANMSDEQFNQRSYQ